MKPATPRSQGLFLGLALPRLPLGAWFTPNLAFKAPRGDNDRERQPEGPALSLPGVSYRVSGNTDQPLSHSFSQVDCAGHRPSQNVGKGLRKMGQAMTATDQSRK